MQVNVGQGLLFSFSGLSLQNVFEKCLKTRKNFLILAVSHETSCLFVRTACTFCMYSVCNEARGDWDSQVLCSLGVTAFGVTCCQTIM